MSVETASGGTVPGTRPEYRLVLLGSRSRLGPGHADEMRALLREGLDWGYLLGLAGYHGVQPLLYSHLKELPEANVPPGALGGLRALVGMRTARSLVLTHELGRLAALFNDADLPVLALKGATLALGVYGSIALRPFVDVDLLVRRRDFGRLERLLVGDGFRRPARTPFQKAGYLFVHGQYTFSRRLAHGPAPAVATVDAHTAIVPLGYRYAVPFDDLWARSRPVDVGDAAVRTLSAEDLLLVLCYHGFKTRWDRVKYICDVAELLRVSPGLDWEAVLARAQAIHSRRVLFLGLFLAHEALGAALPEPIRRAVLAEPHVRELGREALARLPDEAQMPVEPYRDRLRLNLLAQDSFVGRVRYGGYALLRRLSEFALSTGPNT